MVYENKNALFNNNIKTLFNDLMRQVNGQNNTMVLGSPVLTYGSSDAEKLKNDAFDVIRNGVLSTIATAETVLTTDCDVADLSNAKILVYLNAANEIKLLRGAVVLGTTGAVCPATPEGGLKIGEIDINTTGAAFVGGTTSLNDGAIDMTITFANKTDLAPAMSTYDPKHWLHQTNLRTLLDAINAVNIADGETKLLTNPTIAIGSDKKKVKHNDLHLIKDGVISKIATGEVAFTATTHDITADNTKAQEATYLIYLDGSTVKILKGTTADADSVCPALPAGKVRLGEVKIVVAQGTSDFDATTDDLDAGHLTATFTTKVDVPSTFTLTYGQKHYLHQYNLLTIVEDIVARLNAASGSKLLNNPTFSKGSGNTRVAHAAFQAQRGTTMVSKAAETTGVALTATTHNLATGTGAVYVLYLDASNDVKIVMGTATAGGVGAVAPATPANGFKLGEIKIVNASSGTFTANTTHLDATDITTTYTNKIDTLNLI